MKIQSFSGAIESKESTGFRKKPVHRLFFLESDRQAEPMSEEKEDRWNGVRRLFLRLYKEKSGEVRFYFRPSGLPLLTVGRSD